MVIFFPFDLTTRYSFFKILCILFIKSVLTIFLWIDMYIAIPNIFWRTHQSACWLLILILLCMVTSAWYFKPYNFDSVNCIYIFVMYSTQWHSNTYTYNSALGCFCIAFYIKKNHCCRCRYRYMHTHTHIFIYTIYKSFVQTVKCTPAYHTPKLLYVHNPCACLTLCS